MQKEYHLCSCFFRILALLANVVIAVTVREPFAERTAYTHVSSILALLTNVVRVVIVREPFTERVPPMLVFPAY